MKPKPLSHKDLVNLAVHELNQGSTLNQVEKDFLKKDIERKAALKAIEEADYYVKKEKEEKELKARQESEAKGQQAEATKETGQAKKEKSWFWAYLIVFLALVGLAVFYYLYNKNF